MTDFNAPSTSTLSNNSPAEYEAFHLLKNNVRDYGIFLTDPQGHITTWNIGAEHILGYQEQEVIGQPCDLIFTPEDRAKGEPQRERRQAAEEGRSIDERWHLRKNGSRFWASGIMTALFDDSGSLRGYCKILRDFTQQKQTQDALEASHARIEEVLESITDAFYAVDADFRFTYVNRIAESWWGKRREELVGKHYWTLFPQAVGSESYRMHYRAMEEREPLHYETISPVLHKWIEAHIYPTREGGLSVYFRDISERKEVETALLRHQANIEALNQRLHRAMTETHHRVKNSLQVVGAMVDMLTQTHAESIPVSEVKRVGQHIYAMANIQDLLTQEVKADAESREVSATEMLDRLVPLLEQTVGNRSLKIDIEEIRLPVKMGTALSILVNELVSNAVKHGAGAIELSLSLHGDRGALVVRDEGAGFPDDFEWKVVSHTGLELIESIVRLDLGGEVSFENAPEGGARVAVTFSLTHL